MQPLTRREQFLSAIAGESENIPSPITREEKLLKKIFENGGSGADLTPYAKKTDIPTYSPDTKGAVGDGVTIDDAAFLEGDYIYQLTAGKVYRISKNKLLKIYNNGVVGDGVIRVIEDNYYDTHPYLDNELLPTYGKSIYEMSSKLPQNRFEECVGNLTVDNSFNTTTFQRHYKQQGVKRPDNVVGRYRNIGAIYIDYDKVEQLPDQFTLCIGKSVVFQRKNDTNKWEKTIDELISVDSIRNYKLPWGSATPNIRDFTNKPTLQGDHIELVINKEELTSWIGGGSGNEACAHFWSSDYIYSENEYDDLITFWEIWVKEPEASNALLFVIGSDCLSTADSTMSFSIQPIIAPQMRVTDKPQEYWGCTMNVLEAKAVNYSDLSNQIYNKLVKNGNGRNFNLFGINPFDLTIGTSHISCDSDGVFTVFIDKDEERTSWTNFDLTQYLKAIPDIKAGDTFRFYMEILDGTYGYQSVYRFTQSALVIASGYTKVGNVITKVLEAPQDFYQFNIGVPQKIDELFYTKFRIWITKGDKYRDYQPYGEAVEGYVLNDNVVDEYLEKKVDEKIDISTLKNITSSSTDFADFQSKIAAL